MAKKANGRVAKASETKAIYPGSFDPITLGHVDIVRRMQRILGDVTILVSTSLKKKPLFSVAERVALARDATRGIAGVTVESFDGLTVEYARAQGASVIARGLRAVSDFEYELVMANMNKKLSPDIETLIVFASPEFYYVSSNTVKEVAMHGGSAKGLVSARVEEALRRKFRSKKRSQSGP